jgi:AbiV family abortive infection protein
LKEDKARIVPRADMPEGIELCKKNALDFLKDARVLIGEKRIGHAYISVQFAIEELGKILIFKDKLAIDMSDPLIITKKEAFSSHQTKTDRAWRFLDSKFKKIFDEGVFEKECVEKGVAVEDTFAEYETRLDCAFVDYYASRWQLGRDIKEALLLGLIDHIECKLVEI